MSSLGHGTWLGLGLGCFGTKGLGTGLDNRTTTESTVATFHQNSMRANICRVTESNQQQNTNRVHYFSSEEYASKYISCHWIYSTTRPGEGWFRYSLQIDFGVVCDCSTMSILDALILIMLQQVSLMMFSLTMVDHHMSFLLLSSRNFLGWTSRGDVLPLWVLFWDPSFMVKICGVGR